MSGLLGLGASTNTKNKQKYTGIQLQTSALDIPIAIMWGQRRLSFNLIWYGDFKKHKHDEGGKGPSQSTYTYSAAVILALCEGVVTDILQIYVNSGKKTLADLGMTLFSGTLGQAPWSYMVANHPTEALAYSQTAYVADNKFGFGGQPSFPSMGFECVGNLSGTMPSTVDANMADIISDLLVNTQYGLGLTAGDIDTTSWAFYKTYTRAQGLFFSPLLTSQEKANEIIDRWAGLTNSWIFWSGNYIKFVPLGDSAITANGVTYTPNNPVRYNLTVDDFVDQQLVVKRIDPADAKNRIRVEISDRALDYNSNPIEWKDQSLIDAYGLRDDSSLQADEICSATVGATIVALIGQRLAYIRNHYEWSTSYRFVLLEPGDIVTLTDPNLGLFQFPVRIIKIEEDDSENLSFEAEEFPGLIGTINTVVPQGGSPGSVDQFVDPGDVNPPCVFEPDSSLSGASKAQIWSAASGGISWGGCDVYISLDDNTYTYIGSITSPAKQGQLTAALASHVDPDTVNTLSVDLTEMDGQLSPVTHADADAFTTLCLLAAGAAANGELIAYGNVVATGTNTFDLDYLRRGLYGTLPAGWSIGAEFTFLNVNGNDGSVLKYDLPTNFIGVPIYIKFLSFNIFGLEKQSLADVSSYLYTPLGTGYGGGTGGVPTTPSGLATVGGPNSINVLWTPNPVTDSVLAYTVFRAPGHGASFGSATAIWTGLATSYMDSGLNAGAQYTYFLEATNIVGTSSATAGVDGTVGTVPAAGGSLQIRGNYNSVPATSFLFFSVPLKAGDAFPVNLAGSLIECDVAPTATWTANIYKNIGGTRTLIGTAVINAAATSGSYTLSGGYTAASDGDCLEFLGPVSPDATINNVKWAMLGTRIS